MALSDIASAPDLSRLTAACGFACRILFGVNEKRHREKPRDAHRTLAFAAFVAEKDVLEKFGFSRDLLVVQ